MTESVPILRVASVERAVEWLSRVDYAQEWVHRFESGGPAFMSVARAGESRLFLSEHADDGAPGSLVYVIVEDIDAIADNLGEPVVEQDWAREVRVADPDGNRFRFGTPKSPSA